MNNRNRVVRVLTPLSLLRATTFVLYLHCAKYVVFIKC